MANFYFRNRLIAKIDSKNGLDRLPNSPCVIIRETEKSREL